MKPRARRVTIGAVVLVTILLAVLVVANWRTVRDHVEAWHFQLTRTTETITPSAAKVKHPMDLSGVKFIATGRDRYTGVLALGGWLLVLATESGRTVVFDQAQKNDLLVDYAGDSALSVLEENGFSILEQRFPRRAYVVIRDEGVPQQSYVVQKGDTLGRIARKVYGDVDKFQLIEQANPHLRYRTLQVGERIKFLPSLPSERALRGNVPRS